MRKKRKISFTQALELGTGDLLVDVCSVRLGGGGIVFGDHQIILKV